MGFNIGTPPTGFSYYPKEGWEKSCLDHAFVNRFFRVSKTEYVTSIGSHALAGSADSISDHAPLIIDIDMVNTGNTF
jgi:endonuclease/exonuclease/phosphatase family metal-dependent hydrolase